MFKNLKIGSRLSIGFIAIILILILLTFYGIRSMELLSKQTGLIYDHPLTVSNAVLRINANIIKIHRSMKDLAMSKNTESINENSKIVDALEKKIFSDFEIINERYLGEKEEYVFALEIFSAWKQIRDEVVSLMREGEREKAADITRGKGAIHVLKIEKSIEALGNFAEHKAKEFLHSAEITKSNAFHAMYFLVGLTVITAILLAFAITRSFTYPIEILRRATEKIGRGQLDTIINIESKDEIGQLATSFNKMTKDLRNVTALRDERTVELNTVVEHLENEINERKNAEEALNKAKGEIEAWNRELAIRVKEKTEELEKSQAQLIQSEKLSAMGQMAGGLAHELNSPLAGLLPMIEKYKNEAEKDSRAYTELSLMHKACEYMANIVRDFSTFSRESKGEFHELNINELIEDTLSFIASRFKQKSIQLVKEYKDELPPVEGEKTGLQQVVLNVVVNACDGMVDGGKLTIRTYVDEDNENVIMEFEDNGAGIEKEYIGKIFDPFYTTKRPGKGTGLGLSVSYKIIQKHGGNISVESEPGKGSIFTISLHAVKLNNS